MEVTKEFIECELIRLLDLRLKLDKVRYEVVTRRDNEIHTELCTDCNYLILGLSMMIDPTIKVDGFVKHVTNREFLEYTIEFADSLANDLKDVIV